MIEINYKSSKKASFSEENSDYMKAWLLDKEKTISYLQSRQKLSSQQVFLNNLIKKNFQNIKNAKIADIACGAGWSTIHLAKEFGIKQASLYDLSSIALKLAVDNIKESEMDKVDIFHEDISNPYWICKYEYDLIINLMSLSWVENPFEFLRNMIYSLSTSGTLIISTLVNRWHPNIDLKVLQKDNSRKGEYKLNIFSEFTIKEYLKKIKGEYSLNIHPFNIDQELKKPSDKGMGTYTLNCNDEFIEISGGLLYQWGFIEIKCLEK